MDEAKKKGLRFQRTEQLIRDTFREMLRTSSFDQITICDLTQRANINRKTFYLHYPTLDALYAQMYSELMVRFFQNISTIFPNQMDKFVENFFKFAFSVDEAEEKMLYGKGFFSSAPKGWEHKEIQQGLKEHIPPFETQRDRILMAFCAGAILEIYREWTVGGKKLPVEDLMQMTTQLLMSGLLGWKSREQESSVPSEPTS